MQQEAPFLPEQFQDELERRAFHLKTLYEVSHLPLAGDSCPGRIGACRRAGSAAGCRDAGGSTFKALFPVGSG